MENSKEYSDADNTEVTEGRVSFIRSTDAREELMIDAGRFNSPNYLLPVDDQSNEPEHEQSAVPPQSIIEGRPVKDEKSNNSRALDEEAKTYELHKFKDNIMLIFNHEKIPEEQLRYGTEKDVAALKNTFEPLGFECTEYKDLNEWEIFKTLKTVIKRRNLTDIGCVAVCILTHGEANGMLWAKDIMYSELKVLDYFKGDRNPTLLTKPKLLIIQACRGMNSTQAAKTHQAQSTICMDYKGPKHYYLPIEADTLVLHGSVLDTPAVRCRLKGSWLIQALCSNIKKLAAVEDLESILLEVKRTVAINNTYNKINNKGETMLLPMTQMPVVTSTLFRKLYFHGSGFEVKDATGPVTLPPPKSDDVFPSGNSSSMDTAADTIICPGARKDSESQSDVYEKLKQMMSGYNIKELLSDNGGEYENKRVRDLLKANGAKQRLRMPYTPEQNGCGERDNRTIVESAMAEN